MTLVRAMAGTDADVFLAAPIQSTISKDAVRRSIKPGAELEQMSEHKE